MPDGRADAAWKGAAAAKSPPGPARPDWAAPVRGARAGTGLATLAPPPKRKERLQRGRRDATNS